MESESLSVFNNEDTFSANSERLITTFDYVTFDREQILKVLNARQVHHG